MPSRPFQPRLETNERAWTEVDDGEPAHADLTTLTRDLPIGCRDNAFPECIDHIVVGPQALPGADRASFRHATYRQANEATGPDLHPPVPVEPWGR